MALFDLESLGLHAPMLLAGFAGGVCYVALQEGKPSIWGAVSGIIVATLSANYLSELLANYLKLGTLVGPAAFLMGLTANWVCRSIMNRAKSWTIESPTSRGGGQ